MSVLIAAAMQFRSALAYGYDAYCSCTKCPGFNNPECTAAHAKCVKLAPDTAVIQEYNCGVGATEYNCYWSDNVDYLSHCPGDAPTYDSQCDGFCDRMNCSYAYTCEPFSEDDDDKEWCFHADSIVRYNDKLYSLRDFLNGMEPECTIPHVASTIGIIVLTDCGASLRVTRSHLVLTPQGYKEAQTLVVGSDTILSNDHSRTCLVTELKKEPKEEVYFGLNCIHSEVSVDGLSVSTFGDLHYLPSAYMHWTGRTLGVDAASIIGKTLSGLYHKYIPKQMLKSLFYT